MCRWFAYVGHEDCLLEDVLIEPKHAITKQVLDHYLPGLIHHEPGETQSQEQAEEAEIKMRNIMFNIDGFGVAWYSNTRSEFEVGVEGPRAAMYKTVAPIVTDTTFNFICQNTASKCILAHVRAASRPPIVETNNHPFIFGRHSFMHNGGVTFFPEIRHGILQRMKPEIVSQLQGNTDSEHLAGLYFTYLGDTGVAHSIEDMRKALLGAIKTVLEVQNAVLTPEQLKDNGGASSLNLCTSDGQKMLAIRFRNHPTQQPPSLYTSTTAGIALNRKYPGSSLDTDEDVQADDRSAKTHGKHVIVASEPTTFQQSAWTLMAKNELLMVDEHINVKTEIVNISA
ncbi:N-terminal nucleophile aminohydrolase [Peniophora sp. CONT]|nr:N-terminal nucleophile aminohydrolase [Peniophora sp. CONT]